MTHKNLQLEVERIHYEPTAAHPLLLMPVLKGRSLDVPTLLRLTMTRKQHEALGEVLRLTKPGDKVQVEFNFFFLGDSDLVSFTNDTLGKLR